MYDRGYSWCMVRGYGPVWLAHAHCMVGGYVWYMVKDILRVWSVYISVCEKKKTLSQLMCNFYRLGTVPVASSKWKYPSAVCNVNTHRPFKFA